MPMMGKRSDHFGYARREGFTVVSLPYVGDDLQFVVLLPDDIKGLHQLESKLNADILASCAKLEQRDVDLHLPRFKLEPPTIALAEAFQALGMKTAFDIPHGSADFDKIAPRKPNDYLYISNIFHKTFIARGRKRDRSGRRHCCGTDAGYGPCAAKTATDRNESRSAIHLRYSARSQRRLSVSLVG